MREFFTETSPRREEKETIRNVSKKVRPLTSRRSEIRTVIRCALFRMIQTRNLPISEARGRAESPSTDCLSASNGFVRNFFIKWQGSVLMSNTSGTEYRCIGQLPNPLEGNKRHQLPCASLGVRVAAAQPLLPSISSCDRL